jgi:hypothetical protein
LVGGKVENLHTLLGDGTWHKLDGFLSINNKNVKTVLLDEGYVVLSKSESITMQIQQLAMCCTQCLRNSRIEYVWTAVPTK